MADIYALLDEVAGLSARIAATPELQFAHLAPRFTATAIHALETQLVETESTEVPHALAILRKIAETPQSHVDGTNAPLMLAIEAGDALLAELLLAESTVDGRDATSALRRACMNGKISWDIVRLLLNVPAVNVAVNDNLLLQCACEDGQIDIVRLLFDLPVERGVNPAEDDNYPLRVASENGHTDIVRLLLELPLERGVNPAEYHNYALRASSENGHTDIVRMLLALPVERGVDPAADDNYALRVASENGHTDIVRMLLELPLKRGVSLKCLKHLQTLVREQPVISAMLMQYLINIV